MAELGRGSGALVARAGALAGAVVPARPRVALRTFDSFQHTQFRWFMAAMLGWMAAMNMQLLVRGYLVYDLTGSYAALGVVGLASAVPMLLLAPWGGVIADRAQRRTVLQAGQLATMAIAIGVAALLFADALTFAHLVIASALHGTAMALMMPSRQAMIPEIVGVQGLMNAVSLNAAGMNIMRMAGPAVGGALIVALSPAWVYAFMAGLYLWAVLFLFRVRPQPQAAAPTARRRQNGFADLIEGVRYVRRDRVMLVILGMSFATSLLAMPYMMLLPGYVADVFAGDAVDLGAMTAASGAGALTGALLLASSDLGRRGLALVLGAAFLGLAILLFTLTPLFWLATLFMVFVGVGTAVRQALAQVLLQTYVEDAYRGRVMALFMTQFSLMQFGTFLVGFYSDAVGPRVALGSLGFALIVVAAAILVWVPRLRQLP